MTERIRNRLREDSITLQRLTWKKRIEFIWMYYYLWIIGFVLLLSLTVFLTVRIATNIEGYWLYGMFANTMADAGTGSPLWEDFAEYAHLDLKEKKLEFSAEAYFDYLKNQARGNNYYHAFVALTDGGILDFVTMEPPSLAALAESGRLFDLRLEPCRNIYERYRDRLVYFHGMEGEVPVGIDLSDSLLVTKYGLYPESCALGVCAHTENMEIIARFLQFVLREE